MDRWVVERAPHSGKFDLFDSKQGFSQPVASFDTPQLADRCAELLNKHGASHD